MLKLRMVLGAAAAVRVVRVEVVIEEVRLMLRAARRARVGWRGGILMRRCRCAAPRRVEVCVGEVRLLVVSFYD